jgi:hypothetical protein
MTAASVGNKIFFAGGGDNDIGTVTSRVDIYDVSLNTWSTAELSEGRVELASATLGNKVFFAGGNNGFSLSDRVDIYDNSTNTWTVTSLSEGRNLLSATTGVIRYFLRGDMAAALMPIMHQTGLIYMMPLPIPGPFQV